MGACCGTHIPFSPSEVPSMSPSAGPTFGHSDQPTYAPSNLFSALPSAVSSTKPTATTTYDKCIDFDGFTTVDPKGFWSTHTCSDVAELPDFWCICLRNFTGAEPYSSLNITNACCECGGGNRESGLVRSKQCNESPSSAPTKCLDQPHWKWGSEVSHTCEVVTPAFCDTLNSIWYNGKSVELACCSCGGGYHIPFVPNSIPSSEPSNSIEPSSSIKPSVAPSTFPSSLPSTQPTTELSIKPSSLPSKYPSSAPSLQPSLRPSLKPSSVSSLQPSSNPTLHCYDFPFGWYDIEGPKFNCIWYADKQNCDFYGNSFANPTFKNKTAIEACCVCGGGVTNGFPSQQPSLKPSTTVNVRHWLKQPMAYFHSSCNTNRCQKTSGSNFSRRSSYMRNIR